MYYIDNELLAQLPNDVQAMVKQEGIPMSPKAVEAALAVDAEPVAEGGTIDTPLDANGTQPTAGAPRGKLDDEEAAMTSHTYGDDGQYADAMDAEGRMAEFPPAKKNAVTSVHDAGAQARALLESLPDEAPAAPKKKKPPFMAKG